MSNKKYKEFAGYIARNPKAFYSCLKDASISFFRNELIREFSGTESDKGLPGHNYARVYDALLYKKKDQINSFCELDFFEIQFMVEKKVKKVPKSIMRHHLYSFGKSISQMPK